jgi:hypothetical protein
MQGVVADIVKRLGAERMLKSDANKGETRPSLGASVRKKRRGSNGRGGRDGASGPRRRWSSCGG